MFITFKPSFLFKRFMEFCLVNVCKLKIFVFKSKTGLLKNIA